MPNAGRFNPHHPQAWARYEHAMLLRCEGMTWRDIGGHLGVSHERARQMACKFGRRLAKAMRHTQVKVK